MKQRDGQPLVLDPFASPVKATGRIKGSFGPLVKL